MPKIVYDPTKEREAKNKSVIQAEGKAHQAEDKKIKVSEKTYEAIENKAKAQGKNVEEKVAEIVQQKTSVFPTNARVNDYGFLGFKTRWLKDLGWTKGMALKIEKNADGSITLRKA